MQQPSTEVILTSRGSARVQKILVGGSLIGAVVGAGFAVTSDAQWWEVAIWMVVSTILFLILAGLWFSAEDNARATELLQKTGIVTRADVIASEVEQTDEDTRAILTLEIRPVESENFTVSHRCSTPECRKAQPPSTITTLVDASTRTWAVIH